MAHMKTLKEIVAEASTSTRVNHQGNVCVYQVQQTAAALKVNSSKAGKGRKSVAQALQYLVQSDVPKNNGLRDSRGRRWARMRGPNMRCGCFRLGWMGTLMQYGRDICTAMWTLSWARSNSRCRIGVVFLSEIFSYLQKGRSLTRLASLMSNLITVVDCRFKEKQALGKDPGGTPRPRVWALEMNIQTGDTANKDEDARAALCSKLVVTSEAVYDKAARQALDWQRLKARNAVQELRPRSNAPAADIAKAQHRVDHPRPPPLGPDAVCARKTRRQQRRLFTHVLCALGSTCRVCGDNNRHIIRQMDSLFPSLDAAAVRRAAMLEELAPRVDIRAFNRQAAYTSIHHPVHRAAHRIFGGNDFPRGIVEGPPPFVERAPSWTNQRGGVFAPIQATAGELGIRGRGGDAPSVCDIHRCRSGQRTTHRYSNQTPLLQHVKSTTGIFVCGYGINCFVQLMTSSYHLDNFLLPWTRSSW